MNVTTVSSAGSSTPLVRRALIATVLAVSSILGLQASPASAAVATPAGHVGYVSYTPAMNWTMQIFATGALYPTPTAALTVPGVVANRAPAIAGHQTVRQTVIVQKYINGQWVTLNPSRVQTASIPVGYSRTTFSPSQFPYGPGFYSVVVAVQWYDANGRLVGLTKLDYHHSADYRCITAGCWVGNGFIAI